MFIIRNNNIKLKEKTCIALGNFDGVHKGHRALISECIKYAKSNNLTSCIYTFEEHTTHFLGNKKNLITTNDERIEIFDSLGCDSVYFDDFSFIKDMTPQEFCDKIIISKLNAKIVICGENYRFGKNCSGDASLLKALLSQKEVKVIIMPPVIYKGEIISSTLIRDCIRNGNIELAGELLSRPYSITGEIVHGKKLGRVLGFPTLNMCVPTCKVMPEYGVYASVTLIHGSLRRGITNIGKRPTIDNYEESPITCETHLINYSGDDYGKTATVFLLKFLRHETKFNDIDDLKMGITADCNNAEIFLESYDIRLLEDTK